MTFSHRFGPRPKALPWCVALMLALAVSPAVRAASAAKAPPVDEAKSVETTKGKWAFHLLPKTLQKNPALDMTVITEMTPEGAKRPLVTPEAPAYYFLQPTKLMSVGEGSVGRKPVPADALQAMMQSALAKNGFLAAAPPEHTILTIPTARLVRNPATITIRATAAEPGGRPATVLFAMVRRSTRRPSGICAEALIREPERVWSAVPASAIARAGTSRFQHQKVLEFFGPPARPSNGLSWRKSRMMPSIRPCIRRNRGSMCDITQ